MAIVFKNNAKTTLAGNVTTSATSITVSDGSVFPAISGGDTFFCTFDDGTNNEIVSVTAISGNVLTVVRAQDNTTAKAFTFGDAAELRLVAKVLETFPQLDAETVTFDTVHAEEFIGDIRGAVRFRANADEDLSKGDLVYISGVTGNIPLVSKAKADDASKMPAFGFASKNVSDGNALEVVTFGTISGLDTSNVSVGQVLYVSTTAGEFTTTTPTGESAQIQNIGKVQRSHATNGSIKVGGAGRSNATPNLDDGKIFIGNGSNQAVTSTLDTSIVVENTNLYYTDARVQAVSINNVVEDTTPQLGGNLASNGNDILFADNDKAIFGAGSDLQIYHDNSASYINDSGTGNLKIQGTQLQLQNAAGTLSYLAGVDGGATTIHHAGFAKLATTSTGIDVTGTATMDGLTVDGTGDLGAIGNGSFNQAAALGFQSDRAFFGYSSSQNALIQSGASKGVAIEVNNNTLDSGTRAALFSSNGDISFYNTAGTSQALFWDASAERLGIGNTSPSSALDVTGTISATGGNSTNWNTAYTYSQTDADVLRKRTDIPASVNLNTYTAIGLYNQNSNANATSGSNYPANVAGMLTVKADGLMIYQTYQAYATHGTYERKYYNGTWQSWHLVYDSGVFTNNSTNWNTAYGWGNHASQSYATQSYVGTQISNLVDSSPAALNTLNELAAALGDNENFATDVNASIAAKLPLAGGTMTGAINMGSNNLTSVGTISSGTITSTGDVRADTHFNSTDTNATLSATGSGNVYLRPNGKSSTSGQVHITSSGVVTANAAMQIIGATGSSGYMYIYDRDNGTSSTDGFLLQKSGDHAYVYNRESAGKLFLGAGNTNSYLTIFSNGDYYAGSTKWFDQSRNLTNIGTISSGEITTVDVLTVNTNNFDYGVKISQASGTGYAPASILLQATSDDSRGQGIYHYNTVSDKNWFTGTFYNDAGARWGVAYKSQTLFNSDIAQVGNALFEINTSGNATFAGTISSGEITSNGLITADDLALEVAGNASELKFVTGGAYRSSLSYNNATGLMILDNKYSSVDIHAGSGGTSSIRGRFNTSGLTVTGTINSGAITSTGNLLLDSASAEINLKSGLGTESGAINWTFNTTGTNYASIKLPYATRASTGLHIDSGYPITVDATTRIDFDISGSTKMSLDASGLKVNNYYYLDNKIMAQGTDSYLRINQSNQFSNGVWFGDSNIYSGTGKYIAAGSNGATTNSRVYMYGGTYNGTNVIALDGTDGKIKGSYYTVGANTVIDASRNITAGTISSGNILLTNNSKINLWTTASASGTGAIHIPRAGFITFYGDESTQHSISSRSSAGAVADDLRINSYGAVSINLDANNNNADGKDFLIGRHGGATGSISTLFRVDGDTGAISNSGVIRQTISNVGVPTTYSSFTMEAADAQLDLVSSSLGTWGSAINFVEGASTSTNTNNWSIARKTSSNGNTLNFNFGTANQHDNTTRMTFASDGAITATGYITGTRLRVGDGTDGYFYSDSAGRTAFAGGDFYIQDGVSNYYNYATTQYYGGTSGDSLLFRSNVLIGDNWNISAAGTVTCTNVRPGTAQSRVKLGVWSDSTYGIGMHNTCTYGGLNNDYAMTFQMNSDNDRGFLWLDSSHTLAQGAMALTTNGLLTVANGLRVGYGESDTAIPPTGQLQVNGTISSGTITSSGKIETSGLRLGNATYAQAIDSKSNYLLIQRDEAVPIEMWGSSIQSRSTHYFGGSNTDAEANIDTSGNFTTSGTISSGAMTTSGDLLLGDTSTALRKGTGNALRIQTNSGYVDVGAMNTNYCHIDTDRGRFYFNKKLIVNQGIVSSYDEDLVLQRSQNSSHQLTIGTTGITATGNVTAYSDERLKTNIQTLDSKKALQMRGVSFIKDGVEGSGVIAQEIEEIAPELVLTADDEMGTKSVAYGNLVGYLIEAIKDQQKEIEYMKSEIKHLQENDNGDN